MFLQVIVADDRFVSISGSVNVTIQLMNDEPPQILDTPTSLVFTEEGGAIQLFNDSVTITDADNRLNDSLIQEISVMLENPVVSEDQLIVNGSTLPGFSTTYSCDELLNEACYEEFLQSLQYNNTNVEPGSFLLVRNFVVEVRRVLGLGLKCWSRALFPGLLASLAVEIRLRVCIIVGF